jgi:ADP-dependent NAD(P)H-hydrate dehydratase / NAD(P)H-hydrate epimerase
MQMDHSLLILPDSVSRIDAACVESGMDSFALMTAAGHAVAAAALMRFPAAHRFVALAGPGNNGGDAYVAARALAESGADVVLYQLKPGMPASRDAARAFVQSNVPAQPIEAYAPVADDVVIDGVFGAGLARDVPSALADCIERVTEAGVPVVAIDLPSGIDGRSGHVLGAAFRAEVTVTFMALKPCMLLLPGRDHCGEIEIAEIGVPRRFIDAHRSAIAVNGPSVWARYAGSHGSSAHKYSRGALVVFSGGASHTGAARLAAEAGLRAGAGLVTIASPDDAMAENAAHLTAVMLRRIDGIEDLQGWIEDRRLGTFVLGPGFGTGQKARDFALALRDRRLVLDADGITSFKDDPAILFDAFSDEEPHLVLTPHEGEFARLFPDIASNDAMSKVDKALAAAMRAHAAIVYKGSDTVIASPDGRAAINTNAPPTLATAGSGDVLAGICGALLAQGFPPYEAACSAVWHHAEAALRVGAGLTAEALASAVQS